MYLLNVYSIFKVREVFALTNQLGNFFRFVRSFFEIFQKIFFDHLSGIKKAPITSQRCNRGRNRKSPLTEISGLKSYELVVVYRNLSAIAKFQTHFWRKLGVNWRKLWRKHHNFGAINRALRLPECEDRPSANATFLHRFRDARLRSTYRRSRYPSSLLEADW